jgi:16S rRNA processing protein RimM
MCSSSAKTDAPLADPVVVGRIVRAHGVGGEVVVEPLSDNPDRFAVGNELAAGAGRQARVLRIVAVRPLGAGLRVRFAGVDGRDAAEALRGTDLLIDGSELPGIPGGWYVFELVGATCRDRHAGELGQVVDLVADGGGWLLEIASGQRRLLVPWVEAFVTTIDRERRTIDLDLPEGLVEACTSPS